MSEKLAWLSAIQRDSELTYAQKSVAFALFQFHNQNTGRCFPSHEQIGAAIGGMARTAVSRALTVLRTGGWVSWTRTRGHSWYRLELGRAGIEMPAEMSGSNDNLPEEAGARCDNFRTSDVTKSRHQMSQKPDMEPSTETIYLKPSISPASPAEAVETGGKRSRASAPAAKRTGSIPARRTGLPADWRPDEQAQLAARQAGVFTADLDTVVAGFVSHHRGRGTVSPDWPAMWQSWCLVHVQRRTEREARMATVQPKKGRFQW